jgi:putative thiamine transport system ATP-binding protein
MSGGDLALDGVRIALADRVLIGPLTLTVAPGEAATVMGPSGCGKSSLLAFICGTLDPAFTAAGRIRLGDVEVSALPPERRRIGILFQDDLLFPHMTVAENLAFGLPPGPDSRQARRVRIDAALAEAGLAGFGDRDPATLSGGQRARVALLRTLLSEPRALLLDEPFGRLDLRLRRRFRQTVFDHARSRRLPTLLVTHDPEDAAAAAGPVVEVAAAETEEGGAQPVVVPLRRRP